MIKRQLPDLIIIDDIIDDDHIHVCIFVGGVCRWCLKKDPNWCKESWKE